MALSAARTALRAQMAELRHQWDQLAWDVPNARDYTRVAGGERVTDQERLRAAHVAWQAQVATVNERLRDLHRQDVMQNAGERETAGDTGAVARARAALDADQARYARLERKEIGQCQTERV